MKNNTKKKLTGLLAGALMGVSSLLIPNHLNAEPIDLNLPSFKSKPPAEMPNISITAQNPGDPKYFNFGINGEIPFSKNENTVKIEYGVNADNNNLTKARLAVGNNNFYIGGKFQDLSNEATLLRDASLWKGEIGTKDLANIFTGSLFAYTASMPNFIGGWSPVIFGVDGVKTPVKLSGVGFDFKANPKFNIGSIGFSPLVSFRQIYTSSSAKNTQRLSTIANGSADAVGPNIIDDSSFSWPFNRVNANAGIGLSFKGFDIGYNAGVKETAYGFPNDGTAHFEHKINAGYHRKELDLEYLLTINRFTTYLYTLDPNSSSKYIHPTQTSFDSKINLEFKFPMGIYLKSMVDINQGLPEGFNTIIALGYTNKNNGLNAELFYNKNDKTFGVSFSTKNLEGLFNRKDYSNPQRNFLKQDSQKYTSMGWEPNFPGDVQSLHNAWGNNLNDAISKIKSESNGDYDTAINLIEELESHINWEEHNSTFTASQEYNLGYGVCRDTNGQLLPALVNGVLGDKGYQAWGATVIGSYLDHEITIIKKPNGKFDLMQYNLFYATNARTVPDAIAKVFPGLYMIGGGRVSPTAQKVLDSVNKSVWK